jgi:outer membrane immunogenic protein
MIRNILMTTVAATAMVGSAYAADLPSRKAPPPAYIPPPLMTWTGFYVGVNGGGIWSNSSVVTTGTNLGVPALIGPGFSAAAAQAANNTINPSRIGGLGGAQWGYNWQFGSFVLGTESDFQGVFTGNNNCGNNGGGFGGFGGNSNCTAVTLAPLGGGFAIQNIQTIDRRMDYFGTSRVRAGFLVTPTFLIYGTGGVAYGHVRLNSTTLSTITPAVPAAIFGPGISTVNYSQIKAGFTAGGGFEWMFLPNWSVKAEALYYDLGRSTFNQNFSQTLLPTIFAIPISRTATQTTWRNNGVIARAGINYHFNWGAPAAVVARY